MKSGKHRGQIDLAIVFYKQAVNIEEEVRLGVRKLHYDLQQFYVGTLLGTYRHLADLLFQQNRVLAGQQVLELLKSSELREFQGTKIEGEFQLLAFNTAENSLIEADQQVLKTIETSIGDPTALKIVQQQANAAFQVQIQAFVETMSKLRADNSGIIDPQALAPKARQLVAAQPNTMLIYLLVQDNQLPSLLGCVQSIG